MSELKTNFTQEISAKNAQIIIKNILSGDKKMNNSNNLTELPMGKDIAIKKEIKMNWNDELLKTKVSLFNNVYNTEFPEHVELGRILRDIKFGTYKPEIQSLCKQLEISPEKYKAYLLSHIPEFTLSAHCNHRVSDAKITSALPKKLINHTGFLLIDISGLGKNYEKTKQIIIKDKHTFFCYKSLIGDGLKVGIRIEEDYHEESFKQAIIYYLKTYNIVVNQKIKNEYSTCSISSDPKLFINTDSKVFVTKRKERSLI